MIPFEIVTLAVGGGGLVLALVAAFRGQNPFTDLSRRGDMWFDHAEDLPLEARPSEDERDAPIPRRELRSRAS